VDDLEAELARLKTNNIEPGTEILDFHDRKRLLRFSILGSGRGYGWRCTCRHGKSPGCRDSVNK
jgi:hypothetical protein